LQASLSITEQPLNADDPPVINDFVFFDPDTNTCSKARAEVLVSSLEPFTAAGLPAYAVGIVTSTDGTQGTIVMRGRLDISGVTLSAIMESGEVFRDGPYYLSNVEDGKITANPRGIAIYLGYFTASSSDPTLGNFAILDPQYKDLFEAHLHQNFAMPGQPSGDNEIVSAVQVVRGIKPDDYQPGGPEDGMEPPIRLFVFGKWTGVNNPVYTFRMEASDDTMATARIFWSTDDGSDDSFPGFDDPDEVGYDPDFGDTIGVRVPAYETPIAIGSKGLVVVLEKGGAVSGYPAADFDVMLETAVPVTEREFTVQVPDRIRGWLPKWVRELSSYTGTGTDPTYQLYLFGRYQNPGARATETITVEVTSAGDFALGTVDLDIKDKTGAVIDSFSGVPFSGGAPNIISAGDFDLYLIVSKYDAAGAVAATTTAALTDEWQFDFVDEAPNASYEYNMDADRSLSPFYPPDPLTGIVLELNGVGQAARDFFVPGIGSHLANLRTIFWYPDAEGEAPFPKDWETLVDPGSPEFAQYLQVFLTRRRVGGSSLVSSIAAAEGSGIIIVDAATGEEATTGDLVVDAGLNFNLVNAGLSGFNVVKGLSGSDLQTGPVVEKILAGSGVSITEGDPTKPGQGIVRITSSSNDTRGEFSDIDLVNCKYERVPGKLFSYIKFLSHTAGGSNVPSAFTARFRVPLTLTGKFKVLFFASVFGLEDVAIAASALDTQFAGFKLTYNVLPDVVVEGDPTTPVFVPRNLLASGPTGVLEREITLAGDIPFGKLGTGYTAFDPILIHNDPSLSDVEGQVIGVTSPFPAGGEDPETVTAGDLVAINFERVDPDAGHQISGFEYTAQVGFINLTWRLDEVF
jgi:hypothetical protein